MSSHFLNEILSQHKYPENQLSEKSGLTVEFMKQNGYVYWREIEGVVYAVVPMTFGKGRLLIDANKIGYEDFYCFPSVERAVKSLERYIGEDGPEFTDWHRHFKTGRRREDGDPSTEYINF